MTATDPTTPVTTRYADVHGLQVHVALLAGFLTPRPQDLADGS